MFPSQVLFSTFIIYVVMIFILRGYYFRKLKISKMLKKLRNQKIEMFFTEI